MANEKQQEEARKRRRLLLEIMGNRPVTHEFVASRLNNLILTKRARYQIPGYPFEPKKISDDLRIMVKEGRVNRSTFMDRVPGSKTGAKRSLYKISAEGRTELKKRGVLD